MNTHTITIDDEVHEYLKGQADPFVETTHNAVLRRVLLGKADFGRPDDVDPSALDIPRRTPKALEQIIRVAHMATRTSATRAEATHAVADHHGVAFQTVMDKYCRQLGLTADGFDEMLRDDRLSRLKALLKGRFPAHSHVIEECM